MMASCLKNMVLGSSAVHSKTTAPGSLSRTYKVLAMASVACALSACGEKSQDLSTGVAGSTVTRDTRAYDGDASKYALTTFKRGDKTAWETHMKTRIQGQDEYSREK
jgi:hypothetical protein